MRQEIKSIVRGELRYQGYEPTQTSINTIEYILDELAREEGKVAVFYLAASDRQIRTLAREIKKGIR